uniref:DUF4801 domain-containing protein n=1 Tax=Macrostomum lignano TaxID=282301 RepID=A0A1I8GYX0_9PLAT
RWDPTSKHPSQLPFLENDFSVSYEISMFNERDKSRNSSRLDQHISSLRPAAADAATAAATTGDFCQRPAPRQSVRSEVSEDPPDELLRGLDDLGQTVRPLDLRTMMAALQQQIEQPIPKSKKAKKRRRQPDDPDGAGPATLPPVPEEELEDPDDDKDDDVRPALWWYFLAIPEVQPGGGPNTTPANQASALRREPVLYEMHPSRPPKRTDRTSSNERATAQCRQLFCLADAGSPHCAQLPANGRKCAPASLGPNGKVRPGLTVYTLDCVSARLRIVGPRPRRPINDRRCRTDAVTTRRLGQGTPRDCDIAEDADGIASDRRTCSQRSLTSLAKTPLPGSAICSPRRATRVLMTHGSAWDQRPTGSDIPDD